jgi:hypothetical protein
VRGLPPDTQEGLLQQTLEKVIEGVKRVEVLQDLGEAVVELDKAAVRSTLPDLGCFLLEADEHPLL